MIKPGDSLPDRWRDSRSYQEPVSGRDHRAYPASTSRSIKVVWLCANFDGTAGGTGTHLIKWAGNVERSGIKVIFVHGAADEEGRIGSMFASNGHVRVVGIPGLRRPSQLFLPALLKLYKLFKQERPDIVHTILIQSDILGTLAARLAGVPIVISSAEGPLVSDFTTARPKILFYHFGYRLIQNYIDRVIAISDFTRRSLIEEFRLDPAKIHVIHSGVADSDLSEDVVAPHVACSSPSIGVVSRLVEGKGVEYLLMAVPRILEVWPKTRVFVVGDGPLKRYLVKLAINMGVADVVKFCGSVCPAREVMKGFDIIVMPSLKEGLPWVVLEALAMGKPVVATDVGGVPEIITHDLHGLLVEPGNSPALARALIHLLEDPQRASALARAGQARVREKFTASREAAEIYKLYLSLLASKNVHPGVAG